LWHYRIRVNFPRRRRRRRRRLGSSHNRACDVCDVVPTYVQCDKDVSENQNWTLVFAIRFLSRRDTFKDRALWNTIETARACDQRQLDKASAEWRDSRRSRRHTGRNVELREQRSFYVPFYERERLQRQRTDGGNGERTRSDNGGRPVCAARTRSPDGSEGNHGFRLAPLTRPAARSLRTSSPVRERTRVARTGPGNIPRHGRKGLISEVFGRRRRPVRRRLRACSWNDDDAIVFRCRPVFPLAVNV